ncbi:hypothetical protein [Streptomyces sp. NBC_00658]|uniref:hypothetical protein n=1 Tax=Streptomyces sp. NBC_00658 TaxID=2975800 RepID=UPI00324BF29F
MQVDVLFRMEVDDLALLRAQCPPRAAARQGLGQVRPIRQSRHGAQGQRHDDIMTRLPSVHQDLGNSSLVRMA